MLDQSLEAAQDSLLAYGITATADLGTSVDTWEAYRRAGQAERLKSASSATPMSNDARDGAGRPDTVALRRSTADGWNQNLYRRRAWLAWRVAQAALADMPGTAACNS